jgi:hypothetical protein
MKRFDRFKRIGFVSVGVVLLYIGTAAWLTATPVTNHCQSEGTSDSKLFRAHPVKVAVRPWLGRHQVFGIFMVPLRYRSGKRYSGTISVQSFTGEFRPDQQPEAQRVEDVVVEPGSYLIRGYVPTRTALWFLFTGQLGDLRSPCNWTLEFSERSK